MDSRILANGLSGQTTAAIAIGDTSTTQTPFSVLPVVTVGDVMPLTFYTMDSTGKITSMEIVYVLSHASASTTVTLRRGQEGTTAQAWPVGTRWVHGPTARDAVPDVGYKNRIRNGGMSVWQRGGGSFADQGLASPYGRYTADGWKTDLAQGFATAVAVTRATVTPGSGPTSKYALAVSATGSGDSGHYIVLSQSIEGVQSLAGKRVTLSFYARTTRNLPSVGVELQQNFGSGGSPSAVVSVPLGRFNPLSASWARFEFTVDIPSISGKTIGTNGDDRLSLLFWLSAGSTSNARSSWTPQNDATIEITDVQLEQGPYATPFEVVPEALELVRNQRYYQRYGAFGTVSNEQLGVGWCNNTTGAIISIPLRTAMRVVPALILNEQGGGVRLSDYTGTYPLSAVSMNGQSTTVMAVLQCTASVAVTQFRPMALEQSATGAGSVAFTAEF